MSVSGASRDLLASIVVVDLQVLLAAEVAKVAPGSEVATGVPAYLVSWAPTGPASAAPPVHHRVEPPEKTTFPNVEGKTSSYPRLIHQEPTFRSG